MVRLSKRLAWLAALLLGFQSAFGFALLGPHSFGGDSWEVPTIGYSFDGEIGDPKNTGEEYRWNTPVVSYGFDQTFLDYFGSNGVYAVEQAFAILNGLTNFSSYSADLSEFPLESSRINYSAESLHLLDLKSTTLHLVIEELGLAEPERYAWTLRRRDTQPGLSCPFMIYEVVQRNFDPVTFEPSAYVNGVLFSYLILEICSGPDPLAVAFPFPVDPLAQDATAVASYGTWLNFGRYLTGLTRDDVAGLRYGLRTNNVNWEMTSSDSILFATNTSQGRFLITSNLTLFAQQALTTNAAALAALYPGLVITSSTNYWTQFYSTNLVLLGLINSPYDPVGTPPHVPVFQTNLTFNFALNYQHTFGNLVTFSNSPYGWQVVPIVSLASYMGHAVVTLQTITASTVPWDTSGVLVTNSSSQTYVTNQPVGDFAILPTNSCGLQVISSLFTNVFTVTNLLTSTNTQAILTNTVPGGTNTGFFTQILIQYLTNRLFWVYDVACVQSNSTLRQGMDRIKFFRADYDSLVGQFFRPITNIYQLVAITNSALEVQTLQRVITKPDFLFSAQDLESIPTIGLRTDTAGNFNTANALPGLAGPGNIEPNMQIIYNKVAPIIVNVYDPFFILNGLSQIGSVTNFIWGTYDGSTNPPILYPQGTSIADLESQILFQVITPSLPDGSAGNNYAAQLQAAGGQPPYTWSLSAGSAPLPTGLSLSAAGLISGNPAPVGVPTTFTFTVTASDGAARTTARTLSITINP